MLGACHTFPGEAYGASHIMLGEEGRGFGGGGEATVNFESKYNLE